MPVNFDYLMPAELFPFALLGAAMLFWAALRAHAWQRMIGWALVVALVMLLGGQAIAVATGLDSGWFAIVVAALIAYLLALVVIAVGGALLVAGLFQKPPLTGEP